MATRGLARALQLALLLTVLSGALPAAAASTTAERIANRAALQELESAPLYGNIPSYTLPADRLERSEALAQTSLHLSITETLWDIAVLALLLWLGVARRMQHAVQRLRSRWLQGFAFTGLVLLAVTVAHAPLTLYWHVLSRRYGLSVQPWPGWLRDLGVSLLLEWLIGSLLVLLLFWILRRFPRRWWLVAWAFAMPLSIAAVFAAPYVIDPLFDRFEPLQQSHPALVSQLERVVERGHMNIPPERMFLMHASDKVTTLNAYVTGFGSSKRVVVWDNTVNGAPEDEILLIFGHESGHYVLHHIARGLLESSVGLFVALWLASLLLHWLLRRFGPGWGIVSRGQWGALVVLLLIFSVLSVVEEPIESQLSRSKEHAADVYGMEAVHGIVKDPQGAAQRSFVLLGTRSFANPNPPRWWEWWSYSHPATGRRAAFAAHYDPWAPGMEPKYFPRQ